MAFQTRNNLNAGQLQLIESAKPIISQNEVIIGIIQQKRLDQNIWTFDFGQFKKIVLMYHSNYSYANQQCIQLSIILMPAFTHMKQLCLSYNKIQSIDCIASLNSPLLEDIMLMKNEITNIRSLRKGRFPKLQSINISTKIDDEGNNPIIDPTPLLEMISKQKVQFHIERWANDPQIGQSKRWAAKFGNFSKVTLKSKHRNPELHIDAILKAKSAKIQLK